MARMREELSDSPATHGNDNRALSEEHELSVVYLLLPMVKSHMNEDRVSREGMADGTS